MNTIDNEKYLKIERALQNYLRAMHEPPEGVDIDNVFITQIQFIDGFQSTSDPAWVITYETDDDRYKDLILDSELDFSVDEFQVVFIADAKWILSPRDAVCAHAHRYSVVYTKEAN